MSSGQPSADDNDIKSATVGRIDQFHFRPMAIPFLSQQATRDSSIQLLHA
jgi:hypothetical protein